MRPNPSPERIADVTEVPTTNVRVNTQQCKSPDLVINVRKHDEFTQLEFELLTPQQPHSEGYKMAKFLTLTLFLVACENYCSIRTAA